MKNLLRFGGGLIPFMCMFSICAWKEIAFGTPETAVRLKDAFGPGIMSEVAIAVGLSMFFGLILFAVFFGGHRG